LYYVQQLWKANDEVVGVASVLKAGSATLAKVRAELPKRDFEKGN
jgi:hypothetical protein